MTTKTYDNDPLGILETKENADPLGILGDKVKKKETSSSASSTPSLSASVSVGGGIVSTPPLASPLPLDVEGIFSFGSLRKKTTSLPANLPRANKEIQKVLTNVHFGDVKPQELSSLYSNDYSRESAKKVIKQYAPEIPESAIGSDQSWEVAANNINTKNRINFITAESQGINQLDSTINNSIENLKLPSSENAGQVTEYINELRSGLTTDDYSNNDKVSALIAKVQKLQDVEQRNYLGGDARNRSIQQTTTLLNELNERLKYNISKTGITPTINQLNEQIDQAIVGKVMESERGTSEFDVSNDSEKANHFKLGLTAIEKTDPVLFKNVLGTVSQLKKVDDTDFTTISRIGQEIANTMKFRGGAYNPELIGTETEFDYSTFWQKVAEASATIGEWAKSKGYKNMNKFPERIIKQGAKETGIDNPEIVNTLISNENLLMYDQIPKSGWVDDIVSGGMQPLVGINSTLNSWSESPAETYMRSKAFDAEIGAQKVPNAKGEYSDILPSEREKFTTDMFRGLGQFIPQVLLTKGVGSVARGVVGTTGAVLSTQKAKNVSDFAGTAISTFLQSYGPSYEEHLQKTGDADTAALIGTIDGISSAGFELLLPDVKIADRAFAGLRQGLSNNLIDLVKKGGDPAELAQKARPFVQKFFTNAAGTLVQENLEELGTTYVDFVTESIFDPASAKDRNLNKELWDTFKATSVAMVLPSILGAGGQSAQKDFTVKTLHSSAINFDNYKESLQKTLDKGYIDQNEFNAAVKLISTHKESIAQSPEQNINGAPVDKQKQLDYAYEDTKIKVYKEKAEHSDGVAKEMWEYKIKQSEEVQREILMPKEVEALVVDETPSLLSPQETITKAVTDEVITGVEADLIKAGTITADDAILSLAKQKYGVSDDGSIFPEGGRDISMKTSLDVDDAVEKTYPNQQSVIDAVKTQLSNINQTQDGKDQISKRGDQETGATSESGETRQGVPKEKEIEKPPSVSVVTPQENKPPVVIPLTRVEPKPETPPAELGTKVQTSEPPLSEGVTAVTLSGLTEQDRQSKIQKRVAETTVTDTQKQTNDLLKKVKSYNSLPNGRLGKLRPAGLQQLNNIRLESQKLGLTFDERSGQLKTSGNRSVRTDNREVGDRAIAPNAVVLRDRPQRTQEVFNDLFESGNFPNGYRLDNNQMKVSEIDGAVQDILDGIPSERANNYLNQIEKYIAADAFEIGNPGELKEVPTLNELLGVESQTQTEPMTQESLESWLNEQSNLTPQQEQIVIDNIENLIQDYEPATTTEGVVQPTQSTTEAASSPAVEPNTEPVSTQAQTTQTAPVAETREINTVASLTDELRQLLGNNLSEGLAFKDVSNKDIKEGDSNSIEEYNQRAERVLKTLYPNAEFKSFGTTNEYEQSTGRSGEAGVLIRGKDGKHKLFLNLEAIINSDIERTATHEVVHALVSDAIGVKHADLRKKWDSLLPKLYKVKGFEIVKEHIEKYSSADRPVEGITDLLANIVHNKIKIDDIPKNLWDEFIEFVNRAFEAMGIDYKITPDTFNGFALSVKEAFETGDFRNLKKFTSKSKTEKFLNEYPEFAESASAMALPTDRNEQINSFVKAALDRGVNEADLKQALINNGISEADAQGYIDANKVAPAAPTSEPQSTTRREKAVIEEKINIIGQNSEDVLLDSIIHRRNVGREISVEDTAKSDKLKLELVHNDANSFIQEMKQEYGKSYLKKVLNTVLGINKNRVDLDKILAVGVALENEINYIREGFIDNEFNISRNELNKIYAQIQKRNVENARISSKSLNTIKTLYNNYDNSIAKESILTDPQSGQKNAIMETLESEEKLSEAADAHETGVSLTKEASEQVDKKTIRKPKVVTEKSKVKSKITDILNNLKDKLNKLNC